MRDDKEWFAATVTKKCKLQEFFLGLGYIAYIYGQYELKSTGNKFAPHPRHLHQCYYVPYNMYVIENVSTQPLHNSQDRVSFILIRTLF